MIAFAHTAKTLAIAFAGFYGYGIAALFALNFSLKRMRKDEN